MVEQHLSFMLPHEFGGFARDLAIGDLDARNHVGHCRTPISVFCDLAGRMVSRRRFDAVQDNSLTLHRGA
jgi:hypothetical protein